MNSPSCSKSQNLPLPWSPCSGSGHLVPHLHYHNRPNWSSHSTTDIPFLFFFFLKKNFFLTFIHFWESETEHEWRRGRERGRHRIWSRLQALSHQHRAWCGAWTHKLRDHDLSRSQTLSRLSHPGAPTFPSSKPTTSSCNDLSASPRSSVFLLLCLQGLA